MRIVRCRGGSVLVALGRRRRPRRSRTGRTGGDTAGDGVTQPAVRRLVDAGAGVATAEAAASGALRSGHTLASVAGRISDADRERVRDASRIEQVVGEYVALRNAGGGNLKGLCPFHDEKSPSFQVSPAAATTTASAAARAATSSPSCRRSST